jgi:hypothetical protein
MKKLSTFRAAMMAAVTDLKNDPQKMSIMAERGKLVSTGGAARGWHYAYQLTAIIQDFAGDMDVLTDTVLQWVRVEQPGLLKNNELNAQGVRFEVEMLDNECVDVQLEIDLIEGVSTVDGSTFVHPDEPPADPTESWLWLPTT